MGRRTEVLDAAIGVLAAKGTHGFTHRAVDDAAGVPAGTTSNHFRTRDALLQGVVRRLTDTFVGPLDVDAGTGRRDVDGLVGLLSKGVTFATDPQRPNGVAFCVLNYEAASDAAIADLLTDAMVEFELALGKWLEELGSRSPEPDAVLLSEYMRGLIIDQRTSPDPEPATALEPMIRGLLDR